MSRPLSVWGIFFPRCVGIYARSASDGDLTKNTQAVAHQCDSLCCCTDIEEWRETVRPCFELHLLPQRILSVLRRKSALVRGTERLDLKPRH